jgi:hypothetical protein
MIKHGLADASSAQHMQKNRLPLGFYAITLSQSTNQPTARANTAQPHIYLNGPITLRRPRGCPSSQISDAPAAGTDAPAIALFVGRLATRFFLLTFLRRQELADARALFRVTISRTMLIPKFQQDA